MFSSTTSPAYDPSTTHLMPCNLAPCFTNSGSNQLYPAHQRISIGWRMGWPYTGYFFQTARSPPWSLELLRRLLVLRLALLEQVCRQQIARPRTKRQRQRREDKLHARISLNSKRFTPPEYPFAIDAPYPIRPFAASSESYRIIDVWDGFVERGNICGTSSPLVGMLVGGIVAKPERTEGPRSVRTCRKPTHASGLGGPKFRD